MFPVESFLVVVVLRLFPRKWRMVCQNTLPMYSWNPTADQALPKRAFFRHFYCQSCSFSRLGIPDCKSDDDKFCNKALKASFFARITFLTFWFHQDVLFSLPTAILSCFFQQMMKSSLFGIMTISSQCFLKVVETLLPC